MSDWRGQRVLITGATGFIGRHVTRRLINAGAEIWAGIYPPDAAEGTACLPTQVARVPLDVQDVDSVRHALGSAAPDVVFHLAAVGVTEPDIDPLLAMTVNAGGALNLLEALRRRGVGRAVLVGTSYEYGAREAIEGLDPFNAYAASKVAAWALGRMYWRAHGLPIVTVRPFQVYGPGQPNRSLIPAAIRAALAEKDFPMTPGEQQRDFIYVDDVAEGMLVAAKAPRVEGKSIDLGTGIARSVRQAVERVWQLAEGPGHVRPGALRYRPGEVMHLVADSERTARLTGWRATTSFTEGLRKTIAGISAQ